MENTMKKTTLLLTLICVICCVQSKHSKATCLPPNERLDCYPDGGSNEERCEARGCCYEATSKKEQPNIPACSYPETYGGYRTVNVTNSQNGIQAFMERTFPSAFPDDVQLLQVDCEYITDFVLRIKISDPAVQRYESPYPQIQKPNPTIVNPTYRVNFDENKSGFQVVRLDGENVFNSLGVGAFTYANQFIEISTLLSENGRLYGIGEHRTNLTINSNWRRYTLFNHDTVPAENSNLYGSHPFYISYEPSTGHSHGVFLHNSNAMDILTSPKPALTFRTIGGILDFYFFLGPTPEEVVKQYTNLIGKSFIPPYWSLGYHLCRNGYKSAANTRAVWKRTRDLEIPYDVQWNDIDYMSNRNDFTLDSETYGDLPELINDIHDAGMHYIVILDSGVSAAEPAGTYPPFDLGLDMDIFLKQKNGSVLLGRVWNPVYTAWPDFTNPNVQQYWNTLTSDLHDLLPFDGIWIDMNEPSNFVLGSVDGCPDDELENPPYTPGVLGDKLSTGTVCMNSKQAAGNHYDVHNLYGISEADVTNKALRNLNKRPFVVSRSSFAGSGKYTGHWSGDNLASWYDLTKSIQEMLVFNMYGIPLIGADICGFRSNTNQALCNRWTQLGAFYTFARNHNDAGSIDQDPASFDNATIASIKKSLNTRYTLLPYLYTLFYQSSQQGSTVARPLFFEFPNDPKAYDVELAFLWGSALYIVPVLEDNVETVKTYLPAERWYDWYTGSVINSTSDIVELEAPYDTIPLLIRGGHILPTQEPAVTTTLSRKNGFTLVIAPNKTEGSATGLLYWDDGDVMDPVENDVYGLVEFSFYTYSFLMSRVLHWTTDDVPNVEAVRVLGLEYDWITEIAVNGNTENITFETDQYRVLHVSGFSVPLNIPFTIQFI